MNYLQFYVLKTKFLIKLNRFVLSPIKAKYKAKKFFFIFWFRFRKYCPKKQYSILSRYLRMYNYKRSKEETFDRFVLRNIAILSKQTGIAQHKIRGMVDKILS